MSEVVVTETFPGMYEHVTKMGRVGKAHKDSHYGRSAGPQFRKLPFQDHTIQISQTSSPVPSVPSSTPKRSSPVIMRLDEEDDIFKLPEITPTQRSMPKVDSTPFVEMKLGRNMRAAPKGSLAAMSLPDANSQLDASVPLLHNHTLQSNDIAEYFANTHAALRPQTQGSGISSRQYPSRSITSPQHPSQDLIETLNRNNLTSLTQQTQEKNLLDEQRKAAEHQERLEASLRALQEEQRRKQEEEEIRERQRKAEAEQKLSHDFETKNTLLNDTSELTEPKTVVSPLIGVATPPPPVDLYSSYRMSETYEQKTSEQASTQPFSPKDSSYFSRGRETTTTTTGSLKEDNSGNTAPKSKKQESTDDEVDYDIEEVIEGVNNGSENEEIKDDDFDF